MARIHPAMLGIRWITCGVLLLLVRQGTSEKFVFIKKPMGMVTSIAFSDNFAVDCSTNGTNVTAEFLRDRTGAGDWVPLPNPLLPGVNIERTGDVFTILDFGIPDSGTYKCRATNTYGEKIEWPVGSFFIPVSDKLPSLYVTGKVYKLITVGENTNFTCTTSSGKDLILTWYKRIDKNNDAKVGASKLVKTVNNLKQTQALTLVVKNAQKSDMGSYKCVLSKEGKSKYELVTLDVLEIKAPKIISQTSDLDTTRLKDVQLECTITGFPEPLVKWYKGNNEIKVPGCSITTINDNSICEGSKYIIRRGIIKRNEEYKNWLKIIKVTYPGDHGTYSCRSGAAVANINVNIRVKPKISEKTKKVVNQPKNLATSIRCLIDTSNPNPTWTWESQKYFCVPPKSCIPNPFAWKPFNKPSALVPSPDTPSTTSTLMIAKEQGQMYYRCTAKNDLGSDNATVSFLRSEAQEVIKIKNAKTTLVYTEGIETFSIQCDVIRQYGAFGILWFRANTRIYPGYDRRVLVTKSNSTNEFYDRFIFSLTNTTINDTGTYACTTFTDQNMNDTIKVLIKSRIAPNITGLTSQSVKEEQTLFVELRCDTINANPPATVQWYKDGVEFTQRIQLGLNNNDGCASRKPGYYYLLGQKGSPLIICNPKHPTFTGNYKCLAKNVEDSDAKSAQVNILAAAKIIDPPSSKRIEAELGSSLNITCKATGNPEPTVVWMQDGKKEPLVIGKGMARLQFKELLRIHLVNYTCNATNYKSNVLHFSIREMKINVNGKSEPERLPKETIVGISVGCIIFVLLVCIVCFIVYRRQKKQIEEYKELYFLRTGTSDYKIDPDRSLLDQCNDLPYDLDWEFPEERLILGKPLGSGAFGQVVKADAIGMAAFKPRDKTPDALKNRSKLRRSMRESKKKNEYSSMRQSKTTVAVKTLKEGATQSDYKDLASELKILIHLGNHRNIVNVLGACTRGRRLMVIIEFAPYGDLLSFLRGKRDIYEPNWVKTSNNPDQEFTLVDVAMAAYQISRGMEFLASRKCVHRDLAARNVLVGNDFIMKISDFGLARDIYKDDLYVKTTSGLLPVKWMAMESLFDRVYTEKSDVWSFGIVLWEIFTLGGNPYPGLPTEQLLDYLSEGQRMKQPQNCPLEMYTIMRDCWMQFPEQRPEFVLIAERLGKILEKNVSEDNAYICLEMDEESGKTDYYLNPCDTFNTQPRQTVDGYEEALPTPLPKEPNKYDSPLPGLPPDSPGYDPPSGPLPSIPPTYEEATKRLLDNGARKPSESSNESGIGFDDKHKNREHEPLIVHYENDARLSPSESAV